MNKKNSLAALFLCLVYGGMAGCELPESSSESDDGGSAGGGTQIQEVEPNDYFINTSSIVTSVPATLKGNVVCGYSECGDDIDTFAFVPDETREYTIVLKDMDSSDLDLGMYVDDGNYTYIWASDDAPFDGPTETIQMTLDAGVSYYIEVEAWDTPDSGQDYTVTID